MNAPRARSKTADRTRIAHWLARATAVFLLGGDAAICGAGEAQHGIALPPETVVLAASPLPGYKIAVQKCGICHSADYISLQPPQMSLAQWTAEMVKMQHAYGAPIDDAEIKLLGVYLASTYGDPATVTAADMALTMPGSTAVSASGDGDTDVHTILDRNSCLSCHATQQKAVGPAYHDVAVKYSGDRNARSKIEANIRAGGAGKWGAVPMPPFPNLSPGDLQLLADFVLKQ
jgi:cytochrome c551/c552/mono/diheme cytochrome c family protein